MEYIYTETLDKNQGEQIFKILCDSDMEFVPSLSSRNSTTQEDLSNVNEVDKRLPYEYFNKIKEQQSILAVENNNVIGFMSFIEEYSLKVKGDDVKTLYISTMIIRKEYRGRGISHNMYNLLFEKFNDKNIIGRTWSTNTLQIELFKKLGFKLLICIKDDRREGIDTVYYERLAYIN